MTFPTMHLFCCGQVGTGVKTLGKTWVYEGAEAEKMIGESVWLAEERHRPGKGWPSGKRGGVCGSLLTSLCSPTLMPGVPEGLVQPRAVEGGPLPTGPALRLPRGPGPLSGLPLLEHPGLPGAWPPRLADGGRAD